MCRELKKQSGTQLTEKSIMSFTKKRCNKDKKEESKLKREKENREPDKDKFDERQREQWEENCETANKKQR